MSNLDIRQKAWSGALIVLFFVAWELFCLMTGMSDLVLPRPSQVFATLFEKFPILWPHIIQTLATTMLGFVLGVGLGVVLGAVIGVSKTAYDTAYPLLVGFSSIPKVAVVPIFVLWFGSGTVPAVLTALSICFFPIVVNIATGLATTEPEMEDVLKALGASKFDILWNVGLPRTMPFFFASLKVAISYAFVGAVLSETVASNRGIGNVMMTASGHTLGGAQGTPTTRLLPVFVQKNKLDGEKIKISNMAPNLQEPMLIKGDIDAALVFNITSYFNLVLNRQDPDKDYKWFSFGDYGMDLYSNGVMVSRKLVASNPKAVAGLVRAINKGMIAVAKDQNAGMKAALNYDNLINVDVEKRRLQYSFDKLIVSPEMKEIGVGDIKDDRMARAIGIIVEGYQLARAPAPSEIFSREFLPPRAERELTYITN